jgi:hypothetical protein
VRWKVIELWTIPAAEMFAAGDVGLIPWVPLAQFDGPPEPVFQECRIRIDRDAPPDEHENLLAVTQILAGMRYNNSRLLEILWGREAMIESPVLKEFLQEERRLAILDVLIARFGPEAQALQPALDTIADGRKLKELTILSGTCPDVEAFREKLTPECPE